MTRERRQQQRRQRNIERQSRRRSGRGPMVYESPADAEFPGIMGWMQRHARWFILGGVVFLVVSLGAGTIFGTSGGIRPTEEDPAAAVTPVPTATVTEPAGAEPTPDPTVQRTYSAPPEMVIDTSRSYEAIIHLAKGGQIRLELYPEEAPGYVNNFVFLSRNRFYDGLTFHRVIPGFVAQGGDRLGSGFGSPGYILPVERNNLPFDAGVLSMATSPAGVSGSQFFITLVPHAWLQSDFTVFGRVVDGVDTLLGITHRDPQEPNQPPADVIERIEIVEGN